MSFQFFSRAIATLISLKQNFKAQWHKEVRATQKHVLGKLPCGIMWQNMYLKFTGKS